jgi:CheY-like chemotaxis protein
MRVLIVEDQEEWVDAITRVAEKLSPRPLLTFAGSRDAARALVDEEFFDLIVLDLKIPTSDGALDEDPSHGFAAFTFARERAPGTPILVLTGSQAEDFVSDLLSAAQKVDIWGSKTPVGTVALIKKLNVAALPLALEACGLEVAALSNVEIHSPDYPLPLAYDRLIRAFARRFDGARCEVSPLGGLSGAQVLRLRITNAHGGLPMAVVAKLGSISAIRVENDHFERRISLLPAAATPRKLDMREFGAKDSAGVFYQLAEGFDFTAFAASQWNNEAAGEVPARLERLTAPWSASVPQTQKTIGQIRERVLWPADFERVVQAHGLDWTAEFETRPAQTLWCVVHGDLHGENALVAADGAPVLIDYGDCDPGPRSLDPVSLEFSLLFHPKSPLVNGAWPNDEQARRWFDLDAYLQDCPVPVFVRATRVWASAAAAGQRELAATTYAYLVRQLRFSTTNGNRAVALLEGCRALYDTT